MSLLAPTKLDYIPWKNSTLLVIMILHTIGDGKVYVWDMATRDCVHCFTDDGCVLGNTVAVSPSGRYVACGSDSGVVNLYDDQCFTNERPKPLKAVMNLTTAIDQTVFNSSRCVIH